MQERLIALLRLALKYSGTDLSIIQRESDVTIEMRVDGVMRRVKAKYDDNKLIRYLCYMANIKPDKLYEAQTGHFDIDVDSKKLKLRFATINAKDRCNSVLRILNAPELSQ